MLPLHFGQHSTVSGLPGAGDTLRGLSSHRQSGQDASAVSSLLLLHTASEVMMHLLNWLDQITTVLCVADAVCL